MKGPKDLWCPFWKKRMSDVCETCSLWHKQTMVDTKTGVLEDHWACALAMTPRLMHENAQRTYGTQQAIESFRNEMVRQNDMLLEAAARKSQGLIDNADD